MEKNRKLIPVQEGPWELLFQPVKTGGYVNDHSLICADDGSWNITTCGWRGMGTPHEGAVSIARFIWEEEADE
ncbi:hypothetical protein [Paenibacillus sp. LHD-38]|uniref:hypothetical protein n=1 Tax=Paenibacillus sp. LHD-38 TaxID=3072143 RepID=UPI00280C450E|nr:hypothetical protein [Paenibacillus sp. LHD-38]MDQ8738105.1 hypothetical protein [Paenibacillus sp. LHD-38]